MEILVWGIAATGLLVAAIVGARLLTSRLVSKTTRPEEQCYTQSSMEAEILTRSKGPFV